MHAFCNVTLERLPSKDGILLLIPRKQADLLANNGQKHVAKSDSVPVWQDCVSFKMSCVVPLFLLGPCHCPTEKLACWRTSPDGGKPSCPNRGHPDKPRGNWNPTCETVQSRSSDYLSPRWPRVHEWAQTQQKTWKQITVDSKARSSTLWAFEVGLKDLWEEYWKYQLTGLSCVWCWTETRAKLVDNSLCASITRKICRGFLRLPIGKKFFTSSLPS